VEVHTGDVGACHCAKKEEEDIIIEHFAIEGATM